MFHWFASGEQARPVKSPEEPAEFRNMRRFVRVTSWTARPTEEVGTSATASTPSTSSQLRTSCAPMSGRFWWSAETISTGRPRTEPPKSSTAMRAARTEPAPEMSATKPDMSLSTPILTPPPGRSLALSRPRRSSPLPPPTSTQSCASSLGPRASSSVRPAIRARVRTSFVGAGRGDPLRRPGKARVACRPSQTRPPAAARFVRLAEFGPRRRFPSGLNGELWRRGGGSRQA